MSESKRILFLTGTRADFGKLKSLIQITHDDPAYDVHIFVTGMHLQAKYGNTVREIEKCGYTKIYRFINHTGEDHMDQTLAKTIQGFSDYIGEYPPDLIVVHGDRVEALAGAIAGSLNNILVAHIEGGEVSGTIDELIRHAVSKMSHVHFVSNASAGERLVQMGELESSIYEIGSPDVDVMLSNDLPSIDWVKEYYEIEYDDYGVVMFHPVTTEVEQIGEYAKNLVDALLASNKDYVVIYPNNDIGSSEILAEFKRLKDNPHFRIFPSLRFEYFLVLLKYASCMVGNSSAGIREAPYYGLGAVNIGTRQQNRALHEEIINCDYDTESVLAAIHQAWESDFQPVSLYGNGKSDELFHQALQSEDFWKISKQKVFRDRV